MINNRQNGRRRGRGGGGPRSPNSAPNPGNRQDNRSRGNAAQLHEKYKALARDTQLAGDRVQTEYYLQFADHYFRVLNENRPRYEEQRPRRDDYANDEYEGEEEGPNAAEQDQDEQRPQRYEREQRPERAERPEREQYAERDQRPERAERPERPERESYAEREQRPEREDRAVGERNGELRPRRARGPRADRDEGRDVGGERISLEVLPPAISAVSDADAGETPAAPRRRARRPAADKGEDIAPAA